MNITNLPEDIKTLTRSYAGLRSSDGRPHVSDDLLARMKMCPPKKPGEFARP